MRSVKCLVLAGLILSLGLSTGCATKENVRSAVTEAIEPFLKRLTDTEARLQRNVEETKKSRGDIDALTARVTAIESKTACLKDCPPPRVGVIRAPARTTARAATRKPAAKPAAPTKAPASPAAPAAQPVQTAQAAPPPAPPAAAPSVPLRMEFPKPPPFQPSQNAAQFEERERERQQAAAPEPQKKWGFWQRLRPNRPSVCDDCECYCEKKKTRS